MKSQIAIDSFGVRKIVPLLATVFAMIGMANQGFAQEGIKKEASWKSATNKDIAAAFESWLQEANTEKPIANRVRAYIEAAFASSDLTTAETIDVVIEGIGIADQQVAGLARELAQASSADHRAQVSNILDNPGHLSFVRDHTRLLYGRWLARQNLFDESLEQLNDLKVEDVLDPATLLYYQGLMQHQLLKRKACIKTLKRLRENEDKLPRRYSVLAKLMLADMERLKDDSLDEISRMMNDVSRRTGLYRSGKRVRTQEEEVIEKLDKLIKELEEKQRMMQMAQADGTARPSAPAQKEQRASGKGTGEVKSKRQTDGGQWGNLDPAERDAALAEMARDLPPHYRSVIEEYFRKLAQETDSP